MSTTDFIEEGVEWLSFLAGWLRAQQQAGVPYSPDAIQHAHVAWGEHQRELAARARERRAR